MEEDDDEVFIDEALADEQEIEEEQVLEDDEFMDDEDEYEAAMFGSGAQPAGVKAAGKRRNAERPRDEEEDTEIGEGDDDDDDLGSHTDGGNERLHASLEHMPGFRPMIMGSGIKSLPAAFECGLDDQWISWDDAGQPFRVGSEPIPARVLCMCATKEVFTNDAHTLSDFETHTDPVKRARAVSTAALLGMFTTGTAKGWLASPNQSELHQPKCKDMDGEELDKFKKDLQGNVTTYTYHPNAKSMDVTQREDVAAQFGWCLEELYDPSGTEVVAYRIFKLIYDHAHSDDALWRLLMEENADITRAGSINGIPEALRKTKMMQQNKLQRTQINDDDMEITASTQYKRITSIGDVVKMYKAYSGGGGSGGRPLYSDIRSDTPIGCQARPFLPDKNSGGKHPLGPSVAFNFKRYLAPGIISSEHPGVNVAIAGCVDSNGSPLAIHPMQSNPNNYFTAEGRFRPPEWVRKQGCFHVCHDINARNVFNLKFPRPVNGGVLYEDSLCHAFWELNKDRDTELIKAIERGKRYDPPRVTYEYHKHLVHRRLDAIVMAREEIVEKISNSILETEMLSADSIDKSVVEQERLDNMRCYGRKALTKDGDRYILEPQQALLDISEQQERLHDVIDQWYKKKDTDLKIQTMEAEQRRDLFDGDGHKKMLDADHSQKVDACVRIGLRRFEQAYASKKKSGSIPPGWKDVAHVGLTEALKTAAEHGLRNATHNKGRRVDPEDVNAKRGTANVAFAHGRTAQARDFSPFGQWRMFLMHLFSSGVKISGPDVRIMLECWLHAFEPFQEVSFFMLMCGGPGAGKSMRAKRLQALLATGWVKGSGSSSAKAGMNGGMDHLCGRLVYYDEITNDFGSTDSDRIDYLKSITMEQHVNNTRTVKTMGKNGMETFTTILIDSLHFESHLMSTNCGPLGLKSDVEPSTNRAALSDRSWAHITHAADDDGDTADVDFDALKASPEVKAMINQIRVCSCLIAFVLIYIKEIPHCRPDTSFASLLANKWDTILWNEYNLPRPSKRKRIKRRMMFELFAVESAVAEKFFLEETAVAYEDMRPKPDGTLSGYCVDQLVDVIRGLQRCLDHEAILNAWSHSLDHSPATSSHVFQMKTVLSQLHGSGIDYRTLDSSRVSKHVAFAPNRKPPPTNLDQISDDEVNAAADAQSGNPRPNMYGTADGEPLEAAKDEHGNPTATTLQTRSMMQDGMTRFDCGSLSRTLELQRQMRSEYSRRLEKTGMRESGHGPLTVLDQTAAVLTDGVDRNNVPVHQISMTGRIVDAKKAAAALIPTAQDVLQNGIKDCFLKQILECTPSTEYGAEMQMLGINPIGWDFECTSSKSVRGPADYDFNWAMLSCFNKGKGSEGGEGGGNGQKRSLWTNVARKLKWLSRNTGGQHTKAFSLMDIESMSTESMRDTLFLIAQPLSENKVRVAKYNFAQSQLMQKHSRMHHDGHSFDESFVGDSGGLKVHPQHMRKPDKDDKGKPIYYPEFFNPKGLPRLDGQRRYCDYQKRLDHLTNYRAFASCVAPVTFEKDLPIKESEAHNGIYFSKWIANEHAALVVEAATFLARIPGIVGGDYTKVPSSFRPSQAIRKGDDGKYPTNVNDDKGQGSMQVEEDEEEEPAEAPQQDPMQSEPQYTTEEEQRDHEQEQEIIDEQEQAMQPPMASDEIDDHDDMESLGSDISNPDKEGSGLHARPGVAAESVRRSMDESANVPALPYDWDMLAIFLTLKMAATLHNDDVEDHVTKFAEFFPEVFEGEDKEDTLRDLPQICTRFPGLKEKAGSSNFLFPISVSVPLKESLLCDLTMVKGQAQATRELTEAALSMAMGRNIRYNDPEAVEHEAESRGVENAASLEGNLFSRSAWITFTTSAMTKRGMLSKAEQQRTFDQGLNLMMRVRNARAVHGHPQRERSLQSAEFVPLRSFAAQERIKRERGFDPMKQAAQAASSHSGPPNQAHEKAAQQKRMNAKARMVAPTI